MDQSPDTPALTRTSLATASHMLPGRLSLLLFVLVLLTAVRLVGLRFSVVDLYFDESQYWSWAQDPALGYFSKPPLLAWLLTGVHRVCGDGEWCTRSLAPIIYLATSVTIYYIGHLLYDDRVGFWAGLLTAFTPGVVFSTRIISTDVPMLLFWAIALVAYIKILQLQPQKRWAVVLGLSMGLGLLSKYAMIYFIPGMLVAALVSPRARQALKEPAIWLGLLIAALVLSPNIIWNALNSFATFRHTGGLVLGEPFHPSIMRALEFLGSQFGVFGPVVFSVMMLATVRVGSAELIEQDRLMVAFFVTPIVAVTLFAIYSRAYANWASPSIVPGIVASAAILLRTVDRRCWLWGSIALGMVVQITLLVTDTIATRLPMQIGHFTNPYNRTLGWREYAEHAGQLAAKVGAPTIATDNRRTFNTLRYYLRSQSRAVVSWDSTSEPLYDFAHPLTQSALQPILFVSSCPDVGRLRKFFANVEAMGIFPNYDQTAYTRQFFAFKLSDNSSPIGPLENCGFKN